MSVCTDLGPTVPNSFKALLLSKGGKSLTSLLMQSSPRKLSITICLNGLLFWN